MAYFPFAPELGAFYTLDNSVFNDGQICTFNDPEDPNFAGVVQDVTGLDSADVRDSGDILQQADGGFAGTNFYGRRPITMTIQMYGYPDTLTRNTQMAKIRSATNAMRQDGWMSFVPTTPGAPKLWVPYRRQQPTRFTGGWTKTANLSLVSNMAPIQSYVQYVQPVSSYATSVTIENQGDYEFLPPETIVIQGPIASGVGCTITNTTTGGGIIIGTEITLADATSFATLYPQSHRLYINATGQWQNGYIDFIDSTWFGMKTGNNVLTINHGQMQVTGRSAWV